MHTTSTLYNEILAGDHRTEVKAEINGTIYGIDTIVSMQTSRAVFGSGSPTIGLAPSSEINLRLRASTSVIARMANGFIEIRNYKTFFRNANLEQRYN